jgi:hypothetical protein
LMSFRCPFFFLPDRIKKMKSGVDESSPFDFERNIS